MVGVLGSEQLSWRQRLDMSSCEVDYVEGCESAGLWVAVRETLDVGRLASGAKTLYPCGVAYPNVDIITGTYGGGWVYSNGGCI